MRAQMCRALDALNMGRTRAAVMVDLVTGFGLVGLAWFAITLFLAMEPLP